MALKFTILAFLNEIVNQYSNSLSNWRNVAELNVGGSDESPFQHSIRILINSQKDKNLFFNLLSEHIVWICKSIHLSLQFRKIFR